MPARVLLTGFEPFGPHRVNPSEVLVRRLAAAPPEGVRLSTRVLPVAWKRAFGPLGRALAGGRFDSVLMLGLAADRSHLEFERFALNWRAAASPDEDGVSDEGSPIDPAGPAACFATIPIDDLVAACREAGAPARTSNHAGTFLCNQVLYQTLRLCDRKDLRCRAGFLHLPPFGPVEGTGGTCEESQFRAVAAALRRLAAATESGGGRSRGRRSRVQDRRLASRGGKARRGPAGRRSRR